MKKEYLKSLEKELKARNISDIEEIISEYEAHFNFKMEDGKTEEEIIQKLGSPEKLASLYEKNINNNENYKKVIVGTGLGFLDIPSALIYTLMWSFVAVLGAFSIVTFVSSFCLITTINIAGLIPSMPYLGSMFLGISLMALSVLSAIGTIYCYRLVIQIAKSYFRWHNNLLKNRNYPLLSIYPKNNNFTSLLKKIAMISLIVFGSMFVAGYITLAAYAGGFEFWHTWNWFV